MDKVNEPAEVVKKTENVVPAKVAEPTIGEALKPKEETVPLSTFLDLKRDNKVAAKELTDLQAKIKDGASAIDISKGIKEIAEEHNVDEKFLGELVATVKAQTEKGIDDKITEKLKPFEEKDKAGKIDEIFNSNYDRVLESMPEYKDIVNKNVIKSLSLDPANKNKTFIKIIEESYGHLIKGKKTVEPSSPAIDSGDGQKLDKSKLKDSAYMKTVLADPTLKAEYNKGLIDRLQM